MARTSLLIPATPARRCHRRPFLVICLAIGLSSVSGFSPASDAPLWFAAERPAPVARQATELLVGAPADGLEAADYNAEVLRKAVASVAAGPPLANDEIARLDLALTLAVRRYLADLHSGRVDPQQLGAAYSPAGDASFDADSLLQAAVADDRLGDAIRSAAPPLSQYSSLRAALARYRELAHNPAWHKALPPLPAGRLSPGEKYVGIPMLMQRLTLLGDLRAGVTPPARYEGPVVDAIKSFQERHALTANGVIDQDTFTYLNVPPATRARQLALGLERLRWTPLLQAPRAIVVNVPEFMLRAYEVRDGRIEVKVAMRVIVGTARKSATPLFDAEMQFIEFSPYWNVPPSIARGETLPRLRRDPGYFDRQGFEFVAGDGRVVAGFSSASLEAVERGQMRIRQRPGAGNALGDIKFVFPNKDNIYLHHTPTPQLFKRDRRDFSHGCIRVEAPVELAKFVLADEPQWSEERILQAMNKRKSATIRLREALPVVIAYSTTVVRDGRVFFFPDIYGQDKRLEDALEQRSNAIRASQRREIAAELSN